MIYVNDPPFLENQNTFDQVTLDETKKMLGRKAFLYFTDSTAAINTHYLTNLFLFPLLKLIRQRFKAACHVPDKAQSVRYQNTLQLLSERALYTSLRTSS